MSISMWLRASRVRRGLAVSAILLAAGGLVLYRAPTNAVAAAPPESPLSPASLIAPAPNGRNATTFSGPGLHGAFALSHTKVLANGSTRVFGELTVTADAADVAKERAPLSLVVVLDTSGSMSGEKMEQAKSSVISLINDMRDDDEVALVRYSHASDLVQPLARVGSVRSSLISKVREIQVDGGTNIPPALAHGLRALEEAGRGRVKRVVLVSDGLDNTRALAEATAKQSAERGVTISSLGIGLDFDEGYMGAVARAGHGNFAFVKDGAALATFLQRELKETAATTIDRASVRLSLPAGVRFVRAIGADARAVDNGTALELGMGALFAGDTRRVVIELSSNLGEAGEIRGIGGSASWTRVGGEAAEASIGALSLEATRDERAVLDGRDGGVFANATSALASVRQMEAAEAYSQGDGAKAQQIISGNMADLAEAQAIAPAPTAAALAAQTKEYAEVKSSFAQEPPGSMRAKSAAKASAAKSFANTQRSVY
jgi:Ca-activated chloride channel family protein